MIFNKLNIGNKTYHIVDLPTVVGEKLYRLPYIHRILLENILRNAGDDTERAANAILSWLKQHTSEEEVPFQPLRVLMHDTTCGPALVDIAAMRSALAEAGGDPSLLNPVLSVDVSTDHSIGVDISGRIDAFEYNMQREFERNEERYRFMKWATNALSHFKVHPPGTGIMHTLNLEQLASVVTTKMIDGTLYAMPDTMIGTDSHTPMINGIGVLGWGVGGLEAESVMFGMPVTMRVPDIVGVRLKGKMRTGILATDLALTVTERLRQTNLADKYVEFFGEGVMTLTAGERAVVANMAPEFGANSGYFPIDQRVIDYLRQTGRGEEQLTLVEAYSRQQGLWFDPSIEPEYTNIIEINLDEVCLSIAGPSRPQDRRDVSATGNVLQLMPHSTNMSGLPEGAVVLAAITSCTNTSDPKLLIAAGLLAKKARERGLVVPHWVKTSLAPGSPAAEIYLKRVGLMDDLEALGFAIIGYGCTTCIGNSGPLLPIAARAIERNGLQAVAVLSGNRNFSGRVHAQVASSFLASPPLVIAFALAGDANRNIETEPLAFSSDDSPVYLADIWPSDTEIGLKLAEAQVCTDYARSNEVANKNKHWATLKAPDTVLFPWEENSTYIRRPPFADFGEGTRLGTYHAKALMVLGDDITTDHISPAGQIDLKSDAAEYLVEHGENPNDLNVFSSRRGNWEVMLRGLFTNPSIRNLLDQSLQAGLTIHCDSRKAMPLWEAAQLYAEEKVSTVILAGERYGMGSSRDWAAKGAAILGVRAVLAKSFERIHRSNLIAMGILPLIVSCDVKDLEVTVDDWFEISAEPKDISPRCHIDVQLRRSKIHDERMITIPAIAAVETRFEVKLLNEGGIIPLILKNSGSDLI